MDQTMGNDGTTMEYSSLTNPSLHCRAIQGIYWSGENEAPDTTNPRLLKDTVFGGGGIIFWAGISLDGHTDLHVFHGGNLTGVRYCNEILDAYVRSYAAVIGNDFILMMMLNFTKLCLWRIILRIKVWSEWNGQT